MNEESIFSAINDALNDVQLNVVFTIESSLKPIFQAVYQEWDKNGK